MSNRSPPPARAAPIRRFSPLAPCRPTPADHVSHPMLPPPDSPGRHPGGRGAAVDPPNRFEPLILTPDPDFLALDPEERPHRARSSSPTPPPPCSPKTTAPTSRLPSASTPIGDANTAAPTVLPAPTTNTSAGAAASISRPRSWSKPAPPSSCAKNCRRHAGARSPSP